MRSLHQQQLNDAENDVVSPSRKIIDVRSTERQKRRGNHLFVKFLVVAVAVALVSLFYQHKKIVDSLTLSEPDARQNTKSSEAKPIRNNYYGGHTNSNANPTFQKHNPQSNNNPTPFTVDILSIGSLRQLPLLLTQKQSFATHTSIRNFFDTTEIDDVDPTCHSTLTIEQVQSVTKFCRYYAPAGFSRVFNFMRNGYAQWNFLKKKKNPVGWMCAQVRPASGLFKVYRHYVRTNEALPDYLLLIDDDTYFNMELFQQRFATVDSGINMYYAGCLIRSPIHQINNTFPYGGFGTILSKGSLVNLFRPIHCNFPNVTSAGPIIDITSNTITNENNQYDPNAICNRILESNVGEKQYFQNGINLVQLMYRYVSYQKYVDVQNWSTGYCMHSDWLLGYFANYYNVSRHVVDGALDAVSHNDSEPYDPYYYKDVPHARIEALVDSYGVRSETYASPKGLCKSERDCKPDCELCHRASAEWMKAETDRWRSKFPEKFKKSHD